jgi:hypothetical protein
MLLSFIPGIKIGRPTPAAAYIQEWQAAPTPAKVHYLLTGFYSQDSVRRNLARCQERRQDNPGQVISPVNRKPCPQRENRWRVTRGNVDSSFSHFLLPFWARPVQ